MNDLLKTLLVAALLVASTGWTGTLHAQNGDVVADEGALFLLLPVGPKAVGLSRAVTALPGAESVWWNPAGLAEVEGSRVLAFRGENLGGDATAASLVLARGGVGTIGFSYQLLDLGSIDQTDRFGNVTGTITFRDHLGVLSGATTLLDRLALGVNLKLVQARFSCRGQCTEGGVTGTTVAVDVGAQLRDVGGLPLRLAAVVAHAGPDLQIENEAQSDPLPTRLRIAAAYELLNSLLETPDLDLWVTAELEDRWRDLGDPAFYSGLEFAAGREQDVSLFLRAGYAFGAQLQVDGASVGLGLQYENIDLGIAKSLASSGIVTESDPVHISFGFLF